MVFAVIMAGGRGERFWPRSRVARPKQFLNLVGDRSMLQLTLGRLEGLVGIENTCVVTGVEFAGLVRRQLPALPPENILLEPFGRDTAAAIGLAALVLGRREPQGVMVVLPADHHISDAARFQEVLRGAVKAALRGEHIVTLGIVPNRPETGYGYICRGNLFDEFAGVPAYQANHFLEKPGYERALECVTGGDYLWNSGMFVWRIDLFRKLVEKHALQLAQGLKSIEEALDSENYPDVLARIYAGLPKISVDYSILEQADNVLVMPGDFGWDDIGTWTALEKYAEKDSAGNILNGRGVLLDTANSYVYSVDKVVAMLGVEDLIVVNDHDSLLVCGKDRAQDIKKLVQALREQELDEVL